MKVKVFGPLAHQWQDGSIDAWTGAEVTVDDRDTERVGFFRHIASLVPPMAEILEDVAPPAPSAPVTAPVAAKATRPAAATAPARAGESH